MAKRSQRRLARSEKDQLGCMWGFIRLFHFRQGRLTRKLLSDRRRWTSRYATGEQFSGNGLSSPSDLDDQYQSGNDGDGSKPQKVDFGRRSVKKLMAEEMSGVQQGPSAAVEKIETDSKHKVKLGKKCKQSKKNPKVARDLNESLASTSLESQESSSQDLMEQSARNLDLAAVMEEFCSHIRHFQETNQHDGNLKDSGNVQKFISSVKASQLNEFNMDLIRKHSVLQEKLSEATEAFLNQKYIDAKQLARDGKIHQSEQFMDALDILNSNKELFLKLLQDRNSVSLKHMQVKGDVQREEVRCEALEGGKQFQKQSMHKFFRRKAKSEGGNPNPRKGYDSPQASSRIVVLKPSPVNMQTSVATESSQSSLQSQSSLKNQGQSRRVNSNFSFTEIKRKLKHAMRENKNEQHLVSMDNSLHRIPETQRSENRDKGTHGDTLRRDFPSKTYCHIERIARSSSYDRRREKVVAPTDFRADDKNEVASTSGGTHENLATTRAVLRQREYNIYDEAKKHLAEILITEDEEEFSSREFPRTLGRILSLPEYNYSPIFSPGKNRECSTITEKMRFPPCDDSRIVSENVWRVIEDNNAICPSPLKQKLETPLVAVGDSLESRQQNIGSNAEYQEPFSDIKTGDEVIVEITDIFSEEDKNFFEPIVSAPITKSIQADKTANHKIEGSFELSRMDPHEGNQAPSPSVDSFSLSSSLIQKVKDLDDGPERPSPVSVLEPYFLEEDVSSPASSISRPAEPQIQPLQIHFEENDSSSIVITPSDPDISLRICSDDKKPTFEFEETDSSSIVITPSDPDISLRICSDDKKPTFEFDENDSSSIVITPSDPDISLRICSDDKKPTYEYIRAVLQASGLCWDEYFVKYHSSDHLLDPSLFDEVQVLPDQLNSDPKLLFDCINEVLEEIYERYFGCSMWVSFVKPNSRPVPEGNCIIREVWEGIDWHLDPYIPPHSLDQIVAKDLVKGGTWMDLRFNTEAIGIEMGEIMIAELMEDTILELCSC